MSGGFWKTDEFVDARAFEHDEHGALTAAATMIREAVEAAALRDLSKAMGRTPHPKTVIVTWWSSHDPHHPRPDVGLGMVRLEVRR